EMRDGAKSGVARCSGATTKEEAPADAGSPSMESKRRLSLLPGRVSPQTPSKASGVGFTV
ncbi:hypothetical protein LZ30DRAFT_575193, partial [Colletotrichum cereale]